MSILFKNVSLLLRENGHYRIHNQQYLGVEGKLISYIGDSCPEKEYDVVKDYRNKLLMPGLINAHTHSPMVFLRGVAEGLPLQKWLNDRVFPIENKLTKEIIRISSYYAILEMLASGTTSFTDMYFFPEETAKAVKDSGIKASLNKYILCFDENQSISDSMIPASLAFYEEYNDSCDGRLKVDFSIHAEYTNKEHIVKEYSSLCKQRNAHMHIHLAENKKELEDCIAHYGKTSVEWFNDLGTFENPTLAAHTVWTRGNDLQILKDHNVSVVHNPSSNMSIGSGFAPIRKMLEMGINVALGTDGAASNNNLNMFEEMHLASIIHNGFHLDATTISNASIIDMATINGAKAQGRDNTGVIEVGKCADLIALDLSGIHLYPILDDEALITKTAQGSDVCMTMVDGRILYEDGKYLTLDKDKILSEFHQAIESFYQ